MSGFDRKKSKARRTTYHGEADYYAKQSAKGYAKRTPQEKRLIGMIRQKELDTLEMMHQNLNFYASHPVASAALTARTDRVMTIAKSGLGYPSHMRLSRKDSLGQVALKDSCFHKAIANGYHDRLAYFIEHMSLSPESTRSLMENGLAVGSINVDLLFLTLSKAVMPDEAADLMRQVMANGIAASYVEPTLHEARCTWEAEAYEVFYNALMCKTSTDQKACFNLADYGPEEVRATGACASAFEGALASCQRDVSKDDAPCAFFAAEGVKVTMNPLHLAGKSA